jgi:adenylate cyclase
MDARLERKLRRLAGVVVAGAIAGIVFSVAQRHGSVRSVVAGISYGVSISASLGFIEYFVLEGPLQMWLGGLSFATNLIVRSAIYAAVIVIIQGFDLGERIAGLPLETSSTLFWSSFL